MFSSHPQSCSWSFLGGSNKRAKQSREVLIKVGNWSGERFTRIPTEENETNLVKEKVVPDTFSEHLALTQRNKTPHSLYFTGLTQIAEEFYIYTH